MTKLIAIIAAFLTAGPAFAGGHAATGDAEQGEKAFRQCVSCHVVVSYEGIIYEGKIYSGGNANTGPNLYNIAGATVGSVEGFRYSELLEAANVQGIVFTEDFFVRFVMDPTFSTKGAIPPLTVPARSKMSFKVRNIQDAVNIYAYLAGFGSYE